MTQLPPELAAALAANPDLARVNPGLGGIPEVSPLAQQVRQCAHDVRRAGVRQQAGSYTRPGARSTQSIRRDCLLVPAGNVSVERWNQVHSRLRDLRHYEVEDAKGVRTKEYRIKAKLFKARYGREIVEI
jgi:hypothetical protein